MPTSSETSPEPLVFGSERSLPARLRSFPALRVAANDAVNIKHENQKADNVFIRGIAPAAMFDIDGVTLDAGRYWTESEAQSAQEVCVVGPDIVTNMFPYHSVEQAVGQDIWAG